MIYNDFLEIDIPIFPLHPIVNGKCACGDDDCQAAGKHPIVGNWQHTPIWSDEQLECIEDMGQLSTGYGVLVSAGLLVVDIDERNGGVESYSRLLEKIPSLTGCEFIVKTGSGGGSRHLYFKAPKGAALVSHLPDYKGIDFKSSGYVVGPGSLHESGNTYEVLSGNVFDIDDAPVELISLLLQPERHRAEYNGQMIDVSPDDIRDMLSKISNVDVDYEIYIRIGMAVHHATGGTGFDLWDEWAARSDKYSGNRSNIEKRWHSFGKATNPVTLGTLIHYAEEEGWEQPVTFISDVHYEEPACDGLPFSIDGIDLLRPPGFVGEITNWINDQCRFPRESLAVAAALVAMGNVCGLRYEDDITGVTANLFAFCVAASSTGKEAIQQAQIEIHKAAGISMATYGSIKSEQEIVRNAVRHQGIFYIIDELGIFLSKIVNAQKRGGAAYLDGVIGELMKIYSKANGYYLLTGDMRETVKAQLYKELDNETDNDRAVAIEKTISSLDQGLERPFLSLIGYTTPSTFQSITTKEQAEAGFLGRSLLIEQRDSNPKPKKKFKARSMPTEMRAALQNLYSPGHASAIPGRVQCIGNVSRIATTAGAQIMMDQISEWLFNRYAEEHKELSGLEAIVRRGYELMAKISLILAVPSGIRSDEHVRWAFAIMKRDIDEKIRIVMGTEEENERGLAARILGYISADHAESTAVLVNRCRPNRKEDVIRMLEEMEARDIIKRIQVPHPQSSKKTIEKWIATK